jgi:predicted transcriptional regulator
MHQTIRLPRWSDILIEIYKSQENRRYCEKLNRRIRGSMTHLREVVRWLAQNGLVTITPTTKVKRLSLTEKGVKVAEYIISMKLELGEI